ncbi:hypothetical protein BDR26DRAFT_864698 [Obelidium mucronatum]|nr:hypothetical protein BDR26DRAFT_864698 [Obelidium mucronatum]
MQTSLLLAAALWALAPPLALAQSTLSTSTTVAVVTASQTRTSTTGATISATSNATTATNGIPNSGLALGGITATIPAPVSRFGATAHWIHDQGLIVFVGGWGGTWNAQTNLPLDQSIAALSLRSSGISRGVGTWLAVPAPSLVNAPANSVDPRLTSYAVSAVARSIDVGISGSNVDVLYYTFGNSNNPSTSAVYQYIPSNAATIQSYDNLVTSASPRVRSASCLLDPSIVMIHGGADGVDGGSKTQTVQGTYFLSLANATTAKNAWVAKAGSGADPLLHDHSMECVAGIAYMLAGITGDFNKDGSMTAASLSFVYVYTWTDDITAGVWRNQSVSPDPQYGFPAPRRSASLTAVNPSSNLLLLHGGVAADLSISYNDLWQLDTNTFTWKSLNPSPQVRHSHNAIALNNYLIVAFGVISNQSDPNPPIPSLIAYDIAKGSWGDMPTGVAFGAPPPLPTHVNTAAQSSTNGSNNNASQALSVSPPVIYGIVGGVAALILIAGLAVGLRKRSKINAEKAELEQKMVDRLHREDTDHQLALQGILGGGNAAPTGRQVGGELAKVIRLNQTGLRSVGSSLDEEDRNDPDDRVSELDSDLDNVSSFGTQGTDDGFKFSMKVGLNDGKTAGGATAGAATSPMVRFQPTTRASYGSGFTGLTYPSGLSADTSSEESSHNQESENDGTGSSVNGPAAGSAISRVSRVVSSVGLSNVKPRMSMLVESVKSSNRNSAIPRDEPLRPWELPGMGTIKSPTVASGGKQVGSSNSRSPLVPIPGGSQGGRSYSPMYAPDMRPKKSKFSLSGSSSIVSSDSSITADFNESQYMKSLFSQFTDEQILESWNSYVMYTGNAYTLEQIVSLRAIYGKRDDSPPHSNSPVSSPTELTQSRRQF